MGIVILVGPEHCGEQIVTRPVAEAVLPCGDVLSAAFHPPDTGFASAVVPRHPHRREQGDDLPPRHPLGELVAGERRPIVALQHQRRAMLDHQLLQYRQRLSGSRIPDRRPSELVRTPQVPHGEDLRRLAIDGLRRLSVVDRPDRARMFPVQRFHDLAMFGLELLAIASQQIRQDATGDVGEASLERGYAQPRSRLVEKRVNDEAFGGRRFSAGTPSRLRQQFATRFLAIPIGQCPRRHVQALGRPAAGSGQGVCIAHRLFADLVFARATQRLPRELPRHA